MFRIGVSGCGYWGSTLVRTLREMEDVRVEAIADPDPEARRRVASLLNGDVKTHASFDCLLGDRIDGIVVATPPAFHVEQAVAALHKGKAVFLEKPPATSLSDLELLLATAPGQTLMCDYVFCYNPLIKLVKKELGDDFVPVTVRCDWTNWGIVRSDVDAWWNIAPHPLSVLVFLFKQIQMTGCYRGNGFADAQLKVGENGFASIFISWFHPMKIRKIEIVGARRSVIFDDVGRKVWLIKHDDLNGGISSPNIEYKPMPLEAALRDFVACAKTGREPVAGREMIERVTKLMVEKRKEENV